jgi:DNA excision repair protein ERCC-4
MPPVCRIVVDAREPRGRIPDELRARGVHVGFARLRVADYLLPNGVLVERKSVADFHASVLDGRFWTQIRALREASRAPYLLVEGRDLARGPLSERALIGIVLGVIGQGIPVLRSNDQRSSAEWLASLAGRAAGRQPRRDRPAYARRPKSSANVVAEGMLAAVPGISTQRARALLERFGSVRAVALAEPAELQEVRGIGPTQAERLLKAFL